MPNFDRIWVFGGHASPTVRLNDTWWLKVSDKSWTRALGDKEVTANQESAIGGPPSRANMGACYYNGKIYVYGGHGGLNYARVAFDDIYSFDCESQVWEKIEIVVGQSVPPEGRGGHTLFAFNDKLWAYGGWNSETQFHNVIVFDLHTREWNDPDIYNGIPRWNHSAIMVEAIPSWKYFIFGGEAAEFSEGGNRKFGNCENSACYLDIDSEKWTTMQPEDSVRPDPVEYAAMSYDKRSSRLIVFGGWNSGWTDSLYALNVSKIVGPSYAVTGIDPPLGQLSGGIPFTITGCGFQDNSIKVVFTCGKQPVDAANKNSLEVVGTYVSETEITGLTPNFEQFGPKEAVVQVQLSSQDLTTTWVNFNFFMNTRAEKSLAFGAGLLNDQAVNEPVTFIIQCRNDSGANRTSGRDQFQVKIMSIGENAKEIPCEIDDKDDGQYFVTYKVEEECEVSVSILFKDDKGKFVPIRGSPYSATFSANAKPDGNANVPPSLVKHVAKSIETKQSFFKETIAGATIKDPKDLEVVKTLIAVKDCVDEVAKQEKAITLQLDQLEESLRLMSTHGISKETQIKNCKRLFDEWTNLKKIAKETKKSITPLVNQEKGKNSVLIGKLEEDLKAYFNAMKKREFYKYDCGVVACKEKMGIVYNEIDTFKSSIDDLGYNANKFDNPQQIEGCVKHVENIELEMKSMQILWDHIESCQSIFANYMQNTWEKTEPLEMDDEVKKTQKTLKEMKVDKRSNTYIGILDETKNWLTFLPLVSELRDQSMRERHWDAIREKVQVNFKVDSNLLLRDVYNLNLAKYKEDVEEITDQARQEAKMEKTLEKLEEIYKDVQFEFQQHKGSDVFMLKLSEENFEALEENQTQVNAMFSSRYLFTFEEQCVKWQKALAAISEVVTLCGEVQRTWSFLENLFIHSEEVRKELPEESDRFKGIDKEVRRILEDGHNKKFALTFCCQEWVLPSLENVQQQLTLCEKALNEFMESKRLAFPRFYFVSPADLLDILSNGNNPSKVMIHMPKIFQAIETLELLEEGARPTAVGMHSSVGTEYVPFSDSLKLLGKVEIYLQDVIDTMRKTLNVIAAQSLIKFGQNEKE